MNFLSHCNKERKLSSMGPKIRNFMQIRDGSFCLPTYKLTGQVNVSTNSLNFFINTN